MRILYFSRDCTPHDHRFLTALANTTHQVYFLRLEKAYHVVEDRPLPPEIEVVEWDGGRRKAEFQDFPHYLGALRKVLRHLKPDLVHAGPIQRSAFLTALVGFHPLVSMSWGYDLLHDARINSFYRWATRFTLRHSSAMVGDCKTIRQLAVSYGMPDERIVTFPWGVDIQHFNVKTFQRLPREVFPERDLNLLSFNLLSTRGFEPIYGIDVIARAFVIAARQRPELHLTMLGSGSQETDIRRIFLVGNVFDRVHFAGQVPYVNLPRCYQESDIYLSASHSDGSSISLLEAFATGTPAIVSDIPGNQEWITPGENGWLFRDGDAEGLASAILTALDRRETLAAMGRNARRVAEDRADWSRNFPLLEQAYSIAMKSTSRLKA